MSGVVASLRAAIAADVVESLDPTKRLALRLVRGGRAVEITTQIRTKRGTWSTVAGSSVLLPRESQLNLGSLLVIALENDPEAAPSASESAVP